MKSKNQIANELYGVDFDELTGGEKASVTRKYNKQSTRAPRATRATRAPVTRASGYMTVKFGRPGVNGVKEVCAVEGATVSDAFEQTGYTMNESKEGFMIKTSSKYSAGHKLSKSDLVTDGDLILIVPGVDSSN